MISVRVPTGHRLITLIFGCFIVVAGLIMLVLINRHHAEPAAISQHACSSQAFSVGASGSCVKDLQTMVDFMETDGLNECPFPGGARLNVSGTYDAATKQQIKVMQGWLNCYSKQEGGSDIVNADGMVTPATWTQLCNYAYRFPNQSGISQAPYAKTSITAGKNAGCSTPLEHNARMLHYQ